MALVTQPAQPAQLIDTPELLATAVARIRETDDPYVGVDAERAQSYRYSARAYLLQFRVGTQTYLIDPIGCQDDFSALQEVLADRTWIIHAASQDLPCLLEAGLYPAQVFDTELAGRLLNFDRVGLSALLTETLDIELAKEHSAADWSRRPLPNDWLTYAALDVEYLHELRAVLSDQLAAAGKAEWAAAEFAYVRDTFATPPQPAAEPWRRLKGLRDVRTPQGLAIVREIWEERDAIGAHLDLAPTKLLPNGAISEVAQLLTDSDDLSPNQALRITPGFRHRYARKYTDNWRTAIEDALELDASELPRLRPPQQGVGKPQSWQRRAPEAYARWQIVRPAVIELAESLEVPVEQLIAPAVLREVVWDGAVESSAIEAMFRQCGARQWQIEHLAPVLAKCMATL